MKNLVVKGLFVVVASMIFIGCFENDENPIQGKQDKFVFPVIDPANSNNPYDSVGLIHNEAIEYYFSNRTYFGNDYDSLEYDMFDQMSDFLATVNPGGLTGNLKTQYTAQLEGVSDAYWNEIGPDNLNQDSLSSDYADTIAAKLYVVFMDDVTYDPQGFINTIKSWETDVLNDTLLTTIDTKILLQQSSIARFNIALWNEQYNDPNSYLNNNALEYTPAPPVDGNPPSEIIRRAFNWLRARVTVRIPTNPLRAVIAVCIDAGTGVATGNPYAAAGATTLGVITMETLDWPK